MVRSRLQGYYDYDGWTTAVAALGEGNSTVGRLLVIHKHQQEERGIVVRIVDFRLERQAPAEAEDLHDG